MEAKPPKLSLWTENLPVQTTINPKLAAEIGLNESLILLQIAFWINHSDNLRDGEWWTYQSLEDMKTKAFPYWSIATISRIINSLVEKSLLKKTTQYNKRKNDHTQWFSLNIDGLSKLTSIKVILQNAKTSLQDAKTTLQDEMTLPENNTEDNTEIKDSPLTPQGDGAAITDGKTVQAVNPELLAMQEAVKKHLKQYGKSNIQVAKALLGEYQGKDSSLNLSKKFSPALLEKFALWWDTNYKDRDGKPLTRPKNLDSIKAHGETFLETLDKPKTAAPLRFEQRKAPVNIDILQTSPITPKASGE